MGDLPPGNEKVLTTLKGFIKDEQANYALLLTGKWGIGKTYLVQHEMDGKVMEVGERYKIYISLYGVQTLDEVRKKIFMALKARESNSTLEQFETMELLSDLTFDFISETKYVKGISKARDTYKKRRSNDFLSYLKKTYVLIIDDIERTNIDADLLLGLVSNFAEHPNVKVILVANEERLIANLREKDKHLLYKNIKEKAVGETVVYEPDVNKIVPEIIEETVGSEDGEYREFMNESKGIIMQSFEYYGERNFRTLKHGLIKFKKFYHVLEECIVKNGELTKEDEITQVYLLYYLVVHAGMNHNHEAAQAFFLEKTIGNKDSLKETYYRSYREYFDENAKEQLNNIDEAHALYKYKDLGKSLAHIMMKASQRKVTFPIKTAEHLLSIQAFILFGHLRKSFILKEIESLYEEDLKVKKESEFLIDGVASIESETGFLEVLNSIDETVISIEDLESFTHYSSNVIPEFKKLYDNNFQREKINASILGMAEQLNDIKNTHQEYGLLETGIPNIDTEKTGEELIADTSSKIIDIKRKLPAIMKQTNEKEKYRQALNELTDGEIDKVIELIIEDRFFRYTDPAISGVLKQMDSKTLTTFIKALNKLTKFGPYTNEGEYIEKFLIYVNEEIKSIEKLHESPQNIEVLKKLKWNELYEILKKYAAVSREKTMD
jgi:hypothetical protein